MQETLTDIVARSFADEDDKSFFDDVRAMGPLTEAPDMWMVESKFGQRFAYLWEREKSFRLSGEEGHWSFDQAVMRGLAIMHYQSHDKTCSQRDADYWCRQIARPTWALTKLQGERDRWGREWSDPNLRVQAQARDTEYHNTRYTPVTSMAKGQIWRIRYNPGNSHQLDYEIYALVTSLLGGCARLSGYYTVFDCPMYRDRPRGEVWPWRWGEYRYDQQQLDGNVGPGKWAELVEA